jgi:hypothetical protein
MQLPYAFHFTYLYTSLPAGVQTSIDSQVIQVFLILKFKVQRRLRMPIARYCLSVELVRVRSSLDS